MSIEYQLAGIIALAMLSSPFVAIMGFPTTSGQHANRPPSLITAYMALVLPALLLLVVYPTTADAQITCYGFAGQAYTDNTLCPGSNSCCGRKATCLSNRLCHNPNDPEGLWVRGPCAIRGWDDSCGQICLYNETNTNGVLPRVVQCGDGSLCCNNDPQCCQDGKGTFLNEGGEIVSSRATAATTSFPPLSETGTVRTTAPVPTPSTSSSSSSSMSSESRSSPSETDTSVLPAISGPATPGPPPSNEEDNGLKIGLGVGLSCAVLFIALLVFLFFRRKKTRSSKGPEVAEVHGDSRDLAEVHGYHTYGGDYYPSGLQSKMPPLYSGARPENAAQPQYPVEIGGETPTELDSGPVLGTVAQVRRAEMG
ncbi:hypothetical protein QBC41DRAFT_277892 [Cercophora samala]|uniref:Uncharacterized protein n=1 Tax=Cercophora samala TaxID=330535 RepID=A0AA39ZBL7_9PEZI|nr:hypothetical protein QBC41DRAFT_277892 [Cercophora samala]